MVRIPKPAPKKAAPKKEIISAPSPRPLKAGAKALRRGDPAGGRVEADESVAVRQGVVKKKPKRR